MSGEELIQRLVEIKLKTKATDALLTQANYQLTVLNAQKELNAEKSKAFKLDAQINALTTRGGSKLNAREEAEITRKQAELTFESESKIADKKFTIMLGRLKQKPERVITYDFLNDRDILKDTYYCFNTMNPIDKQYPTIFLETDEEKSKDYFDKARYGEKYFRKSFLHIVVESWFSNEHALGRKFISEKIFRATNSCQPFVMIGTHNFVKEFKELGFKSFDKWWDESYDDISDNIKRMDKIKETINFISEFSLTKCEQIYSEMIPILEHNKNHAKSMYPKYNLYRKEEMPDWMEIPIKKNEKFI